MSNVYCVHVLFAIIIALDLVTDYRRGIETIKLAMKWK